MAPMKALAATAAGAPPVRMAFLYFPNGMWPDAWTPKDTGANYTLSPSLEPLASVRDKVLVVSGLEKRASYQGDGHYAKTANFLTGAPITKTTGKDISAGGVSLDQFAAQRVGHLTPLPSLELGIDPVISGVDSNVGYTRLYGSYISWRAPNIPVAREINPRFVYERLFGSKESGADRIAMEDNRSLLDMALDDARRLRHRLGRDDQFKLDEYMDSVRSVEKRIEFATNPDPRDWHPETHPDPMAPPEEKLPKEYQEHVRLMMDLMTLAFQTDQTRIISFMFANAVSGRNFSFVNGVSGGHHDMSHHAKDPDKIKQYSLINKWHVEEFARMLSRMRDIKEGDSTLLDNSMILIGSGLSDGDRHDPKNLPILVGGGGGGALKTGQHLQYEGGTPLCNLYVSMMQAFGTPVENFGDSNGPLAGVV